MLRAKVLIDFDVPVPVPVNPLSLISRPIFRFFMSLFLANCFDFLVSVALLTPHHWPTFLIFYISVSSGKCLNLFTPLLCGRNFLIFLYGKYLNCCTAAVLLNHFVGSRSRVISSTLFGAWENRFS